MLKELVYKNPCKWLGHMLHFFTDLKMYFYESFCFWRGNILSYFFVVVVVIVCFLGFWGFFCSEYPKLFCHPDLTIVVESPKKRPAVQKAWGSSYSVPPEEVAHCGSELIARRNRQKVRWYPTLVWPQRGHSSPVSAGGWQKAN